MIFTNLLVISTINKMCVSGHNEIQRVDHVHLNYFGPFPQQTDSSQNSLIFSEIRASAHHKACK
jgi:hypothetical protein